MGGWERLFIRWGLNRENTVILLQTLRTAFHIHLQGHSRLTSGFNAWPQLITFGMFLKPMHCPPQLPVAMKAGLSLNLYRSFPLPVMQLTSTDLNTERAVKETNKLGGRLTSLSTGN